MRHLLLIAALAVAPALTPYAAVAESRPAGWFVAEEPCPAFQSKNRRSNPGEIALAPGTAYALLARNAADGEWLQIAVPDAPSATARWVLASCGHEAAAPSDPPAAAASRELTENLLALSWQPAFCELRPGTAECRRLNAGRLPAAEARLSIHGLWPQPEGRGYCDVPDRLVALDRAGRWDELPAVRLAPATRDRLAAAMPGAASGLEQHEWLRHGSCYDAAGGQEEYFADTLALAEAVNATGVAALLAGHRGDWLETDRIRAAFDRAFGRGAGRRVAVDCVRDGDRQLIREVSVALRGAPDPGTPLAALILAADPLPPGCPGGIVDPAGLQ